MKRINWGVSQQQVIGKRLFVFVLDVSKWGGREAWELVVMSC